MPIRLSNKTLEKRAGRGVVGGKPWPEWRVAGHAPRTPGIEHRAPRRIDNATRARDLSPMCRISRKSTTVATLAGLLLALPVSQAIDFTVTGAEVTQVRMVDEGFRTFSAPAGGVPISRSLEANQSFDFDAFLLFTDESKVNTEEPAGGDVTRYPITATVTFSQPMETTLTFTGTTVGQEDFSVVPPEAQASQAALIIWGMQNPGLAGLALGRGHVAWDGPQMFDLGNGMKAVVTLKDAFYNQGLQLTGPGIEEAGTVEAEVKVVTDDGPREEPFSIRRVALMGDMIEIEWESELDRLYQVQKSTGTGQINFTDGSQTIVGKVGTTSTTIPRPADTDELYMRVIQLMPQ